MKYLLNLCGLILVFIGLVGVIVPVLPTTPFMILAAYCFIRSNKKLYTWVTTNRIFGKKVSQFFEKRGITLRAKIVSISTMWFMCVISFYFTYPKIWAVILIPVLAVAGTIIIISIKQINE